MGWRRGRRSQFQREGEVANITTLTKWSAALFFLALQGTSGERIEERGLFVSDALANRTIATSNVPPLPSPLLHKMAEREKIAIPAPGRGREYHDFDRMERGALLPRPARHERGEDRGEGRINMDGQDAQDQKRGQKPIKNVNARWLKMNQKTVFPDLSNFAT